MPLKEVYQDQPEPNFASYDFFDLVTGIGYKTFYAGDVNSTSGSEIVSDKVLRTNDFYADVGFTMSGAAGAHDNKAYEINFDLPIEKQFTIKGRAVANVPILYQLNGTGPVQCTIKGSIYKVTDGTESVIASGATYHIQVITDSAGTNWPSAVEMTLPKTTLKVNDLLRLKVETTAPGADRATAVIHDPKNRTDLQMTTTPFGHGTITLSTPTALTLNLPIRIQ